MKKLSFLHVAIAAASMMALSASHAMGGFATSVKSMAVTAYTSIAEFVGGFVYGSLSLVETSKVLGLGPVVALVSAKAHQITLLKRERPHIEGAWRMCPSC